MTTKSDTLLVESLESISNAYETLEHDINKQGWSFLYTPGRTLHKKAKLLFMGLNPGGFDVDKPVSPTTEAGNAYRHEIEDGWLGKDKLGKIRHGESPLQKQVAAFYSLLASKIKNIDTNYLMDESLAANFCPFRSRSWSGLKNRNNTVSFCEELWRDILARTEISSIVSMSSIVKQHISNVIISIGGRLLSSYETSEGVNWGSVKYSVSESPLV